MNTKRVDGALFAKMLANGLAKLRVNEEKINKLNVFPVADGDTGTNMRLTLESGVNSSKATKELGGYLRSVSEGMLYGARGNSGVILSQLFSGFSAELARYYAVSSMELRNAFYRAYRTAYNSVVRPVEGTILTVAREGVENILHQVRRDTSVEQLLSMYLAEMKKSLSYTPELLPELKEAGVVDSGALGYITIVEGMLNYLYGEKIEYDSPTPTYGGDEPDYSLFDENSPFIEGYCMEFILQRMNDCAYDPSFRLASYIKELESLGNSLVAVENGRRVKIHIHTRAPARIIELSQRYGEFLSFKLENMQLQHNEKLASDSRQKERLPLAVISVVNGSGMHEIFSGIGCSALLEGGPAMNTSSREFSDVFRKLNAENILVLPNDKNIIPSARQAVELSKLSNVTILPTENMVEGYFSLAMDAPDSNDCDYRIRQISSGVEGLESLLVTKAVKDSSYHGMYCKTGDCLAFHNGQLIAVDSDSEKLIVASIKALKPEDKSACVLFRGNDADEREEERLSSALCDAFPWLEINILYGGQATYSWLIGII